MSVEDNKARRPKAWRAAFVGDLFDEWIGPERSPVGMTKLPSLPQDGGDTPKGPEPASSSRSAKKRPSSVGQPDRTIEEKMVCDAFDEATLASSKAFDARLAENPGNDGRIQDLCGFAYILAYKVSPRLRVLLKQLGKARTDGRGEWRINNLIQASSSFGIQANLAASDAACEVLRTRLGQHAHFYVESGLD